MSVIFLAWNPDGKDRLKSDCVGQWHGVVYRVSHGARPWRVDIHSDTEDIVSRGSFYKTDTAAMDAGTSMLRGLLTR